MYKLITFIIYLVWLEVIKTIDWETSNVYPIIQFSIIIVIYACICAQDFQTWYVVMILVLQRSFWLYIILWISFLYRLWVSILDCGFLYRILGYIEL